MSTGFPDTTKTLAIKKNHTMFTMFLFLVDDWALSVPQVLHSYYLNSKYFEYTHYVM